MIWLNLFLILFAFCFMEGVAWFTHKYIMHGFLWSWHKSHHEPRHGIFELNDLFAVVFGSIGASLIIFGSFEMDYRFYLGLGVSLYGLAYFLVHDVFVHQRKKLLKNIIKQRQNMEQKRLGSCLFLEDISKNTSLKWPKK